MATNVRNIIIGAARIYISKKDSTTADWTDAYQDGLDPFAVSPQPTGSYVASTGTGGALDTAKWSEVGFTSDGLRVMYEPTFGEVEVDQQLDVAKLFKSSQRVMLATTLTEGTLRNLLVVFGASEDDLKTYDAVPDARLDLSIGALNAEPVERQFVAVGNAPGATVGGVAKDRERVYYARRVLSVEASEHALTRNEATRFPVTFRLLGDPRYSDTYGRIVDRIVA
jgi:hypothetical protein